MALGTLQEEAASLVRRTRAGDQNAWALIKRVGEEARAGGKKAKAAYAAILKYIDSHPVKKGGSNGAFGQDASASAPSASQPSTAVTKRSNDDRIRASFAPPPPPDPEMLKPELPRGFFDSLFDPDRIEVIIIKACKYRHGLLAAAVVLAAGPPITKRTVESVGMASFGSDEATATFFHGVKFSGESEWKTLAPKLDAPSRRALVVGQCFGRACRLQAVRRPGSRVSHFAPVAGWELGEDA